jgi:PAS domain S-box-containing protein
VPVASFASHFHGKTRQAHRTKESNLLDIGICLKAHVNNTIKKRTEDFFFAGTREDKEADVRKKIFLTTIFSLIGTLMMFVFGAMAVFDGNTALAVMVLGSAVISSINYLYLRLTGNHKVTCLVIAFLMIFLCLYLLNTGGKNNTGPLWFYVMPQLMYYVLGLRQGTIALGLLLLAAALMLFPPGNLLLHTNYPDYFKYRFLGSLLAVSIMALAYEYMREDSQRELLREIGNRRRIEQQLSETLDELEAIFSSSRVGIVLMQNGAIIRRCNQRVADILGYDNPAEMKNLSMRDLHLDSERFRHFNDVYAARLCEGELLQIEYELRRKDGVSVWCSLSGVALDRSIPADPGKGVVWVLDDIGRRKEYERERERLVTELEAALTEVKTLSGMLPICSHCKKIRDDNGYWNQLETYITKHSEILFSHGLCEECSEKLYGGEEWYERNRG